MVVLIVDDELKAQTNNESQTNHSTNEDSSKANIKLKSPRGAMIRSLLIPGLGQYYNEKRLKAVVIFCGEVGLVVNSIYLNQKYKASQYQYDKEFYIENRNLSNWWLVGSVLFSILDAYVDAHLHNFDESPELSVRVNLYPEKKEILFSCFVVF